MDICIVWNSSINTCMHYFRLLVTFYNEECSILYELQHVFCFSFTCNVPLNCWRASHNKRFCIWHLISAHVEEIFHWWKQTAGEGTTTANPRPRRHSRLLNGSIYLRRAAEEHSPAPHKRLRQKSISILSTRNLIKTGPLFFSFSVCLEETLTPRNH